MGRGTKAASALVGLVVALAVYSIAMMFLLTEQQDLSRPPETLAPLSAQARTALDLIVERPGVASTGGDWSQDPDAMTRFGLASQVAGLLDVEKLRLLKRGDWQALPNGVPDYAEIRSALGLPDHGGFHLRTAPVAAGLDDPAFTPLRGIPVAYVGDFQEVHGGGNRRTVNASASMADLGTHVRVDVTIHNNGTQATVFQYAVEVPLRNATASQTQNTRLLLPDQAATVSFRLYRATNWAWADAAERNVTIRISDVDDLVGTLKVQLPLDMRTGALSGNDIGMLWIDAATVVHDAGTKATFYFGAQAGDGKDKNNVPVTVELWNADTGSLVQSWSGGSVKTGSNAKVTTSANVAAGNYTLGIRNSDGSILGNDTIHASATEVAKFTPGAGPVTLVESAVSVLERALLASMLPDFVDRLYNESGDVYPDAKSILNGPFADNLPRYRVLVVGSEVDHNSMTSAQAKLAVMNWVLDGGLLVVFGSSDQQVGWLQPLFQASLATSSGGVGVPDPTHPILNTPERLKYLGYKDRGYTWRLASQSADAFTHVVVREGASGGGQGSSSDFLAVSKPGYFGEGSIILSAWTLWGITDPPDERESKAFLYNVVLQALNVFYVDFGPPIPTDRNVGSATRLAVAPNPMNFLTTYLTVEVILYVW
ncbi:MAG TPA: hypothetical protein VM681_05845 [Candidatus Thermoplasmatota archaeon]|nr:hypothetical protein [Candidatus Thermoplasmatota archaeon]